jgi:hypothetical protein
MRHYHPRYRVSSSENDQPPGYHPPLPGFTLVLPLFGRGLLIVTDENDAPQG